MVTAHERKNEYLNHFSFTSLHFRPFKIVDDISNIFAEHKIL
jgi:hypothetical protein